ncbi:multidrug efflux MFS transporter Cmr [Klugiella xanthotipulae]|uniref:DHA3 family multidrug efflux protein-like MFS transporter n=1 Tax=Klugiella xanthotipulae TaxID=244735 RepID=A0A543HYE6_9MICO|nr:MFS transporter [Klugiella xanthotipulae]TQM63339.1 DHA3 family multidrug efflux protein-like MFS transporter [Klugiella xanthotipulae]
MVEPSSQTVAQHTPPAGGAGTFAQVLVNTLIANVTTSFLWFALTFWVYLETRSVLATGIVGGAYMLLVAAFSIGFGTMVDRHRKRRVMVLASMVTLAAFSLAGALYLAFPEVVILDLGGPLFWVFAGTILCGAVVENMRNVALSTTVTLLVPEERHANANGLVGMVQGVGFIVTSVFSGLAIGFLGMGWALAIAVALTAVTLVHLMFVRIPEEKPHAEDGHAPAVDLRGSIAAIRSAPGLFALIIFSTFNNLIGGVYMALMDPYGLELFPVQLWGMVFGVAATGFIVGGLLIARFGLGRNPIRTMLLLVVFMGLLGSLFTIREWWWLYVAGIWVYMMIIPAVEASEQTVIQKVVPYRRQGRVFGFAQAFEAAAAPITAFLIAPIAEFGIIPYMKTDAGQASWGWLLGEGDARGIALVFFFAGLVMVLLALGAFLTRSYRLLSAEYLAEPTALASETVARDVSS